uniref:Uncharacterized protein n=1 Tax=Anguilla anguilla TaxID=7936 RepID=A0A0E9US16_ANGAN
MKEHFGSSRLTSILLPGLLSQGNRGIAISRHRGSH